MVLTIHLVDETAQMKTDIGQQTQMVRLLEGPMLLCEWLGIKHPLVTCCGSTLSMIELCNCCTVSSNFRTMLSTVKKFTCLENNSRCETWIISAVVRLKVNKHFVATGLQDRRWVAVVTTQLCQHPAIANAVPINHSHKVIMALQAVLHKKCRESVTIIYIICSWKF